MEPGDLWSCQFLAIEQRRREIPRHRGHAQGLDRPCGAPSVAPETPFLCWGHFPWQRRRLGLPFAGGGNSRAKRALSAIGAKVNERDIQTCSDRRKQCVA
jgi:hypothetical protein